MSFQVALIDKSEIVQKMLSHCLHYFSAEVSRFDSLEACQSYFKDKKLEIVFVDWEIKKRDLAVIHSAMETFQPVPVVLLYRNGHVPLDFISSDKIPYKIQKPLEPKAVRDIFMKLVPDIKESAIHSFLRFPKSKGQTMKSSTLDHQKNIKGVKVDSAKDKQPLLKETQSVGILDEIKERTQTFVRQTFTGTLKEKTNTQNPVLQKPASLGNKAEENIQSDKDQVISPSLIQKDTLFSDQKSPTVKTTPPKESEPDFNRSSIQDKDTVPTSIKKIKKEDINIDENTQNDLAPMAIKSSVSKMEYSQLASQMELSEKDIIRVLNKYKDSLEFQDLMEKVLSEYAKTAVKNILQGHKVTDLMKQPLDDFKEGERFKQLVEQQITQYVQKHLPTVIKNTVEKEIQKIIGN